MYTGAALDVVFQRFRYMQGTGPAPNNALTFLKGIVFCIIPYVLLHRVVHFETGTQMKQLFCRNQ